MTNTQPIRIDKPFKFTFKFLDENGRDKGIWSKTGTFDGQTLALGRKGIQLPIEQIAHVARHATRMLITTSSDNGTQHQIAMNVYGTKAEKLHKMVNIEASKFWAQTHFEKLKSLGRENEFHSEICPQCHATVDLIRKQQTPQIYCIYCDSLSTLGDNAIKNEIQYRICNHCNLYAKNIHFTVFYLIFAFVAFYYRYNEMFSCRSCVRTNAWKMMIFNTIFILGAPFALIQLIRAYCDSKITNREFAGLDKANNLIKKKKYQKGIEVYKQITERINYCAGIQYNIGIAYVMQQQYEQAALHFELALNDCSSFQNAAVALIDCYDQLGMQQEVEAIKQQWSDDQQEFDDFSMTETVEV